MQHLVGVGGGLGIMGHHDNRLVQLLSERLQQLEDLGCRLGIEIARRLVGHQQRRIHHQGAGDRHPLFLATGKLARKMVGPVGKVDQLQDVGNPLPAFRLRHRAVEQWQLDVLVSRQHWNQVIELEDVADILRPPFGQLAARHPADIQAVDDDLAGRRRVDPGDQVEQRCLAGAGRPH